MGALAFLLPYRKLELRSGLSRAEATRALAAQVEPRRDVRFCPSGYAFEGTVSDAGFDVQRIILHRNTLLPEVRGQIRSDELGSVIAVEMRLALPVAIILAIWLAGAVVGLLLAGASALRGADASSAFVIPLGMLALVVLLTALGFSLEAMKAERLLRRILQATVWRPGVHPSYGMASRQ